MILLYVLSTIIPLCHGQNANLTFEVICDKAEDTKLTVDAVYTDTGTPSLVTWTYSGSSLSIETTGCTAINSVPAVFPDSSRLSYKCVTIDTSLPANTYQLLVANLQADEFGKIWAVTFTPPSAAAPVAVQATVPSGCPSSVCPKDCEDRVIASIVFGILGIIALAGVIIGIVTNCFNNPVCLTVAVLCIVFDIISLALSASVLADDDCKDCEDWILNSAIAFVVIPSIVAVTAIVLTILVLLGVIGPGRNGITKKDLRPSKETVCKKLLRVLESAYPKILLVKDLIRKVDAEESVVMEQLEELKRKDLIRQLDSGGFVRHFLDVKTGITKKDLRPLEETVCEKLLHVLESVYPNILSVKDLIRIDFAEESVVMEQLEELRRKDLIKQLDSGGFVRHFLDVKTAYKAKEAKEPGENDRLMETSN